MESTSLQNVPKLVPFNITPMPYFDTFSMVGLVDEFGGGGFAKAFITPKDTKCEPL